VALFFLLLVLLFLCSRDFLQLLLDLTKGDLHIHPHSRCDDLNEDLLAGTHPRRDLLLVSSRERRREGGREGTHVVFLVNEVQGRSHLSRWPIILREAIGERVLRDHLLEEIFLVEEDEDGRVLEERVLQDVLEESKRLVHPIHRVVFEEHCCCGGEEESGGGIDLGCIRTGPLRR
jgi:hypothetical protein